MEALHGAAMVPGSTYSLAELSAAGADRWFRSGIAPLDRVASGVGVGGLWAIVGARAVGVSQLALGYAVHAVLEHDVRVLVVNEHLRPAVLHGRVLAHIQSATRIATDEDRDRVRAAAAAHLAFASWVLLPEEDRVTGWQWHDSTAANVDLVVLDCLDEIFPADGASVRRDELTAIARGLRSTARLSRQSILITARLAPRDQGMDGARTAWSSHSWHEAVMDAADVVIVLADGPGEAVNALVDSRVGRSEIVTLARESDGSLRGERATHPGIGGAFIASGG